MSLLRLTVLGVVAIVATVQGTVTRSQIITTPNIEKVCRSAPTLTYRKTVVYVDLASIKGASLQWGWTILNRLELAPRESLTVVAVNPGTFEAQEVFETCYPTRTNSEIEEARRSRGWWDKVVTLDPADQQRDDLQTFETRLKNALNRVEKESITYKETERRNILGAIALDKNRYSERFLSHYNLYRWNY